MAGEAVGALGSGLPPACCLSALSQPPACSGQLRPGQRAGELGPPEPRPGVQEVGGRGVPSLWPPGWEFHGLLSHRLPAARQWHPPVAQ